MRHSEALELRSVEKTLGELTFRAQFSVKSGERVGISARSGFGKSTLLGVIAGLIPPDSGQIWLGGNDVTALPPEKREIGYVFQGSALFPALSLLENATFALRVRGVSPDEREKRVRPWLERSKLWERRNDGVTTLSGGERQRVALIRAVMAQPRLILLDEPFASLDQAARKQLVDDLLTLHHEMPVPLLMVSHSAEELDLVSTVRLRVSETSQGIRSFSRD